MMGGHEWLWVGHWWLKVFLGLLEGGSGWFCAGYEYFWGGYQWGVFWVFLDGYGW